MTIDSNYNLPIVNMTGADTAFQSFVASSGFSGNIFGADYSDVSQYVPSLPELMGGNFDFLGCQAPQQTGWFGGFNFPQLQMPDFSGLKFNFTFTPASTSSDSSSSSSFDRNSYSGTLSEQLIQKAKSYVGKVNTSAEGNRIFSGHSGKYTAWCADFVTYNVKQIYGSKLPSDFGSSSVDNLRSWGEGKNCYLNTRALSNKDRADYIAKNVKPGDIMIEKDGGKSHTGIVTKVYSDGSFDTVEGNTSSESKANRKVDTHHYTADSATLSGFVTLDKYSA